MPLVIGEGMTLPITRRGLFSQDDFFQRFQNEFNSAVDDVMNRWESRSLQADRFASYQRLRERDTSNDTIAATISDTGDAHMIVIDMSEFASGQITVQTVQCSAVIEGKCGVRSYKRQFPLPPNTDLDRVVADLSDENILTVTAPRKGAKVISINTESSKITAKPADTGASSVEAQIIPSDSQAPLAASSSTTQQTETGGTAVSTTAQTVRTEALVSEERKSSQGRIIPLNVEGESSSQAKAASTSATSTTEVVTERVIPTTVGEQLAIHTTHQSRVLPINRRGRFFQDRSFERVWKDFETAIDEMVERRGPTVGLEHNRDRIQSYRNLRKVVQLDDNQAAKMAIEGNECKIVVDVKDLVDGLDVKAVQGAVIVSGRKAPYSFERRFSIPGLTQPEKVSAAISTDGILTITAPL